MLFNSINFYTAENTNQLWGFIRTLLETTAPGVMIWVAITAVGILLTIVVSTFRKSAKDLDKDGDEDYEVRRY